jgi:hypothetical protein
MRNGQWVKACGGDFGAYWKSGAWHRFDCIGCMFALKLLHPSNRLQGRTLPQDYHLMPVEHRHDKVVHGQWLAEGRPI